MNDNLLKSEIQKLVKTYEDYPFNEAIFLEIKRKIREVYLKKMDILMQLLKENMK